MSFDFSKLRGRIIEKFGSQAEFSKVLGVSENVLSKKMQNKVRFTSDDVTTISELLGIQQNEIGVYFFTPKV